ncbi:MAG TPA: pyruvate formate lyase family protein [Dehalococcoidales bacterium]|nr:pyruvate formate lyase family protein [Dehalococcoidales bacterium]
MENITARIVRGRFPLCFEKARLITDSYKQTEGEPAVIRCAKAYAHMLENIPVFIGDDELFVGEGASKPWGAEIDPFLGVWKEDEIRGAAEDGIVSVEESDWPMIREIGRYWETRCSEYAQSKLIDDRFFKYLQVGITLPPMKNKNEFRGAFAGSGLCLSFNFTDCYTNFDRWMIGLNPVIREIEKELEDLRFYSQEAVEKKLFLTASLISLKAILRLADRYADTAEKMATAEKNSQRKKELTKIAEACRRVPANSPESFYQAMQSLWFNQILSTPTSTHNLGRFDQYMYPFFKNDLEKGLIDTEETLALLCELRIKCMRPENIKLSRAKRTQHAGFAKWRNMTVGGVTADGKDASNELTYLVLEAANRLRTPHHTITLRVHEETPEDLLVKALEVVKTGIGMPAMALDQSFIDYMTSGGISLEDARNFHLAGCVDPAIPGKQSFLAGLFFVVPKVLEIFLNNGTDPRTKLDIWPGNQKVEDYQNFEDFYTAFKNTLSYFISLWHEHTFLLAGRSGDVYAHNDIVEMLDTVLMPDGIKMGKPLSKRDAVPPFDFRAAMVPVGAINVVDSLAAIKLLVFEKKKITLQQLKESLASNWEGCDEIRKICLQAPKYGNDDDYVDSIAADLYRFILDEESKYHSYGRPINGKIRGIGGASISSMFAGGTIIGATPDGRLAGTTLSDGTVSPAQGMDINGPTALLKSAAKIDQASCSSTLLNVKLHPSSVTTKEDLKKLGNLVKTYADMGGKWVQFNVIGNDQLLDAQQHPENYRDLIVRVAGYSAYFVDLSKGVQDDIIRRMEVSI